MSFEEKYLGKGTSFWFKFEPMGRLFHYLECTVYGATGFLDYMIEDNEEMRISGYGMSDGISDLQISVIFRNEDGSFPTAAYKAKDTIGQYIN